MKLDIFSKLAELRDKYPENTKFIEQLALIAFQNNGEIPKKNFELPGWNYDPTDLSKIFRELDIFEEFHVSSKMSVYYTKNPFTAIEFN